MHPEPQRCWGWKDSSCTLSTPMEMQGSPDMKVKELAVGFGIGTVLASSAGVAVYEQKAEHQVQLSTQIAEAELVWAFQNLSALSALQRGDVATSMDVLEVSLSLNAVVLHELSSSYQVSEPERIDRMIERIAEYRAEHPYRSGDQKADTRVTEILRRLRNGGDRLP